MLILSQLNPESKDIIMMPDATLLKHVNDILDKKFELDLKLAK